MTYFTIALLALLVLGIIFIPGYCWKASWDGDDGEQTNGESAFVRSMLWLLTVSLLGLIYMLISAQVLYPLPFSLIVGVVAVATLGPATVRFFKSEGLKKVVAKVRSWLEHKVGS